MFRLLEFIGNLFTSIVSFIKTTINMFVVFFQSVFEVVEFALNNGASDYLPAFVLPAFVLLVVYAVIKLIINRQ